MCPFISSNTESLPYLVGINVNVSCNCGFFKHEVTIHSYFCVFMKMLSQYCHLSCGLYLWKYSHC